uniref:Uncharacterized protein n=1 Tax=Romanomermis culicivorax TaxID=13658 RepID=A0A915INK2_ROMCU
MTSKIIFTKLFCGALGFSALVNITFCIRKMIKTSSVWQNDRDPSLTSSSERPTRDYLAKSFSASSNSLKISNPASTFWQDLSVTAIADDFSKFIEKSPSFIDETGVADRPAFASEVGVVVATQKIGVSGA